MYGYDFGRADAMVRICQSVLKFYLRLAYSFFDRLTLGILMQENAYFRSFDPYSSLAGLKTKQLISDLSQLSRSPPHVRYPSSPVFNFALVFVSLNFPHSIYIGIS